jgi:hypothetical protein
VPVLVTVKVNSCRLKVAETVVFAVSVTVHEPVPVHPPPLQPANTEPAAGWAFNVTLVPLVDVCVQSSPHAIPTPETVPPPVPARITVKVNCAGGGGGGGTVRVAGKLVVVPKAFDTTHWKVAPSSVRAAEASV